MSALHKFGAGNMPALPYTVWDTGASISAAYPYQAAAVSIEAVSSSIEDDTVKADEAAGSGAWTIFVQGLDANWNEVSEIITLNGAAAVAGTKSYIRVFRAYVLTAGSSGAQVGNITIRIASAGATLAYIASDAGQTLMATWSVPLGKTFSLERVWASTGEAKVSTADLRVRLFGGVFRTKVRFTVFQSLEQVNYDRPLIIPAKSDIEVIATGNATEFDVYAGFDGLYL